jgi:molecular chaperone HscB
VPSEFPDHFALFGLEPRFTLDAAALAQAHLRLLAQVHPDRHALADAASRRAAMQWASRANEALEILLRPSSRAGYLCALRGAPVELDGARAIAPAQLEWLMQWREDLEDAGSRGDAAALARLAAQAEGERSALEAMLAGMLDAAPGAGATPDPAAAGDAVRRLVFAEKLCDEARSALSAIENHGAAADL